jgi:hypothetical protein
MVEMVGNFIASAFVLAMITAMTRPGSQGPKLVGTTFSGVSNVINSGLGGNNYSGKR